jgi:beta propeller repeat protein/probable HAF family extracellular repeat protein
MKTAWKALIPVILVLSLAVLIQPNPGICAAAIEYGSLQKVTKFRITNSSVSVWDMALGNNGTKDFVVYSVKRANPEGNSMNDPGAIWFQELNDDGSPSDFPKNIDYIPTGGPSVDVYGDYMVYELDETDKGNIKLYQLSTGQTHIIDEAPGFPEEYVGFPKIHGGTVVWLRGSSAWNMMIMRYRLSWLGLGIPADVLAGPVPGASLINIGSRYVVWTKLETGFPVYAYDLDNELEIPITQSAQFGQASPATCGNWIVWEEFLEAVPASKIKAKNLETGETITICNNGAMNYNPSIDGDLVAWNSDVSGNLDIWVYRLSTGETFQVTTDPAIQYYPKVFGNKVAYLSYNPNGPNGYIHELYVASLSFAPKPTDLGTWESDPHSMAFDVNLFGQIAGGSSDNPAYMRHALLWNSEPPPEYLGALAGFEFSEARGLNDLGQVVGVCRNSDDLRRGFLWFVDDSGNQVMQNLGIGDWEGAEGWSSANAINRLGQVVGEGGESSSEEHAVVWNLQNGVPAMQLLSDLGGNKSAASDINDNARVVGWCKTAGGEDHAVLWTDVNSLPTDLHQFLPEGTTDSYATAINDAGQVVGYFFHPDYVVAGFRYADGKAEVLKTDLDHVTFAYDINNLGQVVGCRGGINDYVQGVVCLWNNGAMEMRPVLPLEGGRSSLVQAINDLGVAVGFSRTEGDPGDCHAVVWKVPLPPETKSAAVSEVRNLITYYKDKGFLSEKDAQSLFAKLDAVDKQIGEELSGQMLSMNTLDESKKSNLKAACNLLRAFINQVNAMCRSGRIQPMQADNLIEQGELAIRTINPEYVAF